jgi:hypothetical protein
MLMQRSFAPLAALWALVAIPSCCATYVAVERYDGNLFAALVVFMLATPVMGVLLIAAVAPCAFGEPLTVRGTLSRLGGRGPGLVAQAIAWRLLSLVGLPLGIVPGWYIAVRTGFFAEKRVLSKLAGHLHDRRTSELLQGEFGDLFARSLAIGGFCGLLWLTLVATIDFASTYLLGLPILWGRLNIDMTYLPEVWSGLGYLLDFFWSDPLVVTTALAAALMAYVPGRLAWFFCYVDVRVRRDCWDMELEILREAARLETV